jgi:hypothetical protein
MFIPGCFQAIQVPPLLAAHLRHQLHDALTLTQMIWALMLVCIVASCLLPSLGNMTIYGRRSSRRDSPHNIFTHSHPSSYALLISVSRHPSVLLSLTACASRRITYCLLSLAHWSLPFAFTSCQLMQLLLSARHASSLIHIPFPSRTCVPSTHYILGYIIMPSSRQSPPMPSIHLCPPPCPWLPPSNGVRVPSFMDQGCTALLRLLLRALFPLDCCLLCSGRPTF